MTPNLIKSFMTQYNSKKKHHELDLTHWYLYCDFHQHVNLIVPLTSGEDMG